ncbi:MAG: hypothetical protein ABJI93_01570 [Nonlabens ulvanivorans]|uniref:hypothetical protein n=1 Tax=Nonlabens ulvanivorans TaxID=906888 RepID=UPI003297E5D1
MAHKKTDEKEYNDFKTPIDILKHLFDGSECSIFETIRFDEISMSEFMEICTQSQIMYEQ